MKKNDSGITLIALVMTIIVLIIIVSISSYEGSRMIATSKVQTLETNMLTIQAKAKAYAEEVEAKVWTENKKEEATNNEFTKTFTEDEKQHYSGPIVLEQDILDQVDSRIKNSYVAYSVTKSGLDSMGLKEIVKEDEIFNEDETPYIVVYSKTDYKIMDVIYATGINYNDETFYSLSHLQSALETD